MRMFALEGVSWERPQVNHVPPRQHEGEEIGIACRRCIVSRSQFPSIRAALRDGWRRIEEFDWQTEPCCNHRGLCPACRTHPEEE